MVATIAAGTSAGYYLAQAEYYLGAAEPKGRWVVAAASFGAVSGAEVDAGLFERLHAGVHESGTPLLSNGGGRVDRVAGYDVTFSAPKSVSVVWALASPDQRAAIEQAQAGAVRAALKVLEQYACVSRRGRGGHHAEAVALTAATFQHGESRPAEHDDGEIFGDPQLHTHAVVLNLAQRSDGSVGTLDGRRLFSWKMAAGAVYHLALATDLQRLGLEIVEVGKNGIFEVAGPSQDCVDYFSARRAEIEAELGQAGLTSAAAPALASAVTKTSRKAKATRHNADRHRVWQRHAIERGFDPERIAAEVLDVRTLEQGSLADVAAKLREDLPRQLTQTQSVFQRRELLAATAAALVGTDATAEDACRIAEDFVSSGAIVELGADAIGEMHYSTADMIKLEQEILTMAQTLATRALSIPDAEVRDRLVIESHLSAEQSAAVCAATSPAAIAVIEGAAGTGKTTSLRPIVDAHRAAGYTVVGSATAWRIANQLRDDLRIEARATDSWLTRAAAGLPFLNSRSLLIVDEAGQVSSRQMHAILTAVADAGAKLVLVGDRQQLQPIEAGGALSIVARATDISRIEQVVRQNEEWSRTATMELAGGRITPALQAYSDRGFVHFVSGRKATISALVDTWSGAGPSSRPLVLARTNADVGDINAEIRERLRARSALRGPDRIVDAVSPSGHSLKLPLATGDEVRFLSRNDHLGVVNGTTATVIALDSTAEGATKIHARIKDREVRFLSSDIADETGRVRLAHAYASTIYAAQGMTVDRALVLVDPISNRHDAYVALSRARRATDIFVDRRAVDAGLRADRPLADRALQTELGDEARLAWLSERLSRSAAKGTTLDCLLPVLDRPSAVLEARAARVDRQRASELER